MLKNSQKIDASIDKIVKRLHSQMYDIIFEAVNEEMSKLPYFQEETYFTEEGINEFEEAWFEFYHEHHGEILGRIMKTLTN